MSGHAGLGIHLQLSHHNQDGQEIQPEPEPLHGWDQRIAVLSASSFLSLRRRVLTAAFTFTALGNSLGQRIASTDAREPPNVKSFLMRDQNVGRLSNSAVLCTNGKEPLLIFRNGVRDICQGIGWERPGMPRLLLQTNKNPSRMRYSMPPA